MRNKLFIAMASAGLLAACGGGSSSGDATPAVPTTAATVNLSGVAAKGLMANADVAVYAVNAADGSVSSTPLATTQTGANGQYSLSFAATQGQPVVIKVSANALTTHADEVTHDPIAPLPLGFFMRSLLVPAASGNVTTTASITPFSEMAVAAAAKASGGVTAANAAQAISTVTQLLGFNPMAVTATTPAAAASGDEQKLAVMLTAVSQLASAGGLGCADPGAGERAKCVVEKLGSAATTDSLKLTIGSGNAATDVSAALGSAVSTVLADPALVGNIASSSLATVMANLACTTNCTPAASGTPPPVNAAATAIAGAKLMFGEMKSDWSSMFSQDGASAIATGAANAQAFKFKSAMDGVQVPVETLGKDLGALLMGVDLYNDYKAGRTSATSRGRGDGASQVANDNSGNFSANPAVGCRLYQDADALKEATAPDNAAFIGCGARYYYSRRPVTGGSAITDWRHGFLITPSATDGSFSYTARARRRVETCIGTSCSITTNEALQPNVAAFTGTLSPTLSAPLGDITRFTLVGELPAAFKPGSTTLVGHKHAVNLSGTQTLNADDTVSSALSGSIVARSSSDAVESTLTVKGGSLGQIPVSFDAQGNEVASNSPPAVRPAGHTVGSLSLDLVFSKADGEFEGVFAVPAVVWDKSGYYRAPTQIKLSGALRTITAGVTTEFLSGMFTVNSSGFDTFDGTQAFSSSNRYGIDASFVGSVSAPGRPVLELSFGASMLQDSEAGRTQSATLQYRTLVGGKPRLVVAVTASPDPVSGAMDHFKLTEASANLSMVWVGGTRTVDLLHGDTLKIGSVDTQTGLITFTDSSFISLDIGL